MVEVEIEELLKYNYVVDVVGTGIKQFEFNATHLQEVIKDDLIRNFDCINYVSLLVKIEDGITTDVSSQDSTRLELRVAFKTDSTCEVPPIFTKTITTYLGQAFVK
jgi:hypothetical protein